MTIVSWEIQQRHNYRVSIPILKSPSPLITPHLKATAIEHIKKQRGQGIHMAHVFSEQP